MAEKKNYKKTLITCYIGFITQAIVANFTPLLFLRFHNEYNIPLGEIALISTVFYVTQIVVDTLCATIVDRIGYRKSVVISQFLAGVGLVGLATLPNLLSNPFAGILISVIVYAMGSGMIEVLVSPIVEACPFEHKDSVMSLLHSFYCWGAVGVISLSTLFKVCPKAYRLLNGVPTVETARSIVYNINRADHFYPNTSANVIERKKYITLAIADCDQLLQDMQCLIAMDVASNINVFERVTLMIDREIELLKGYRKSVKLTGAQTPEQRLSALEEEIERLRSI